MLCLLTLDAQECKAQLDKYKFQFGELNARAAVGGETDPHDYN